MCENKEIFVVFLPFSRLKQEGLKEPRNCKSYFSVRHKNRQNTSNI